MSEKETGLSDETIERIAGQIFEPNAAYTMIPMKNYAEHAISNFLLEFAHAIASEIVKQQAENGKAEPFGYFKAESFGWVDCAKDDEGAIALYDHPPAMSRKDGQRMSDQSMKHDSPTCHNYLQDELASMERQLAERDRELAEARRVIDQEAADYEETYLERDALALKLEKFRSDVERCYKMLLSEPDTKGALSNAENVLRESISTFNDDHAKARELKL